MSPLPSCFGANPDPDSVLAWLSKRLRAQAVDGTGYDANGVPHALHVDESTIFDILAAKLTANPLFLNQGELTATAQALRGGDTVLGFHGVLYTPSKPDGQVRGTIDGRQVALLVPMN